MIYKFRKGYSPGIPAQEVGNRLMEIEAAEGSLTPQLVVEDARPEDSVLHPAFDWENEVAGEKWRIHQARQLIASVVVTQIDDVQPREPVRAFVNVRQAGQDEREYMGIVAVMSDDALREQLLENAQKELLRWRAKYAAYEEFSHIIEVIDEIAARRSERRAAAITEVRPSP